MTKQIGIVLWVMLLLLLALPAYAQDSGTTPPATTDTGTGAINWITLVAGLGVGLIAGGGSVLAVASRLRHDTVLITAMEQLAASWPAETRELLRNLAWVVDEVADDVSYKDKPASGGNPNLN